MKRIGIALGLLLLASLFAAGAFAADTAEGKKAKEAGLYSGVVVELDLKANKMVVAQNDTDLAMVFNTSKAKAGSGYKALSGVKLDDQVKVKFEAKAGTIYALVVAKGEKPAPRTKPTTKPHP